MRHTRAVRFSRTQALSTSKLHEALVEAGDDFDEDDYAPVITPMPDDEPEVYDFAPIFMAPKRSQRRVRSAKTVATTATTAKATTLTRKNPAVADAVVAAVAPPRSRRQ